MSDEGKEMSDATIKPETVVNEKYEYGRLWPDGHLQPPGMEFRTGGAPCEFEIKNYELKQVPASGLRPVFGRQRVVVTTEIYPAEAVQP